MERQLRYLAKATLLFLPTCCGDCELPPLGDQNWGYVTGAGRSYCKAGGELTNERSSCEVACNKGYGQSGAPGRYDCVGGGLVRHPPTCTACPRGKYKDNRGADVCTSCPKHSTTWNIPLPGEPGSDLVEDCGCEPGFFGGPFTSTSGSCSACPRGSYNPEPPRKYQDATCQKCPSNHQSTVGEGSVSVAACACDVGYTAATVSGTLAATPALPLYPEACSENPCHSACWEGWTVEETHSGEITLKSTADAASLPANCRCSIGVGTTGTRASNSVATVASGIFPSQHHFSETWKLVAGNSSAIGQVVNLSVAMQGQDPERCERGYAILTRAVPVMSSPLRGMSPRPLSALVRRPALGQPAIFAHCSSYYTSHCLPCYVFVDHQVHRVDGTRAWRAWCWP